MAEALTKSAARNVFYGGSFFFFAIFLGLTAHSHYYMLNTSTDTSKLTSAVARGKERIRCCVRLYRDTIGAPGSAIYSTTAYNLYESYNGTSMATPHVTGAAALYASVKPGATAAEIKNALLSSAVPTSSLSGKTVMGGRLDANGALSR